MLVREGVAVIVQRGASDLWYCATVGGEEATISAKQMKTADMQESRGLWLECWEDGLVMVVVFSHVLLHRKEKTQQLQRWVTRL